MAARITYPVNDIDHRHTITIRRRQEMSMDIELDMSSISNNLVLTHLFGRGELLLTSSSGRPCMIERASEGLSPDASNMPCQRIKSLTVVLNGLQNALHAEMRERW